MATVALIVTGKMEHYGLADSLGRVFPKVEFSAQMVDGFTTTKVIWPPPSGARGVPSAIEKYARAFLAALDPGRRKVRPDFVFGIDDLELENRDQPEKVIDAVRHAVHAELERRKAGMNAASYDKFANRVREYCSFHLFVPMPEAYFYADPATLQAIGCVRQPMLAANCDVERFVATDPVYLGVPPSASPSWAIDLRLRPFHPKRYLEFLLQPASYSETEEGLKALSVLNWQRVQTEPERTLFLRSLFQDLAFAAQLPIADFPGKAHPLTSNYGSRTRVLRNF